MIDQPAIVAQSTPDVITYSKHLLIHLNGQLLTTRNPIYCFVDKDTLNSNLSLNDLVTKTELNMNRQAETEHSAEESI